MSPARVVSQASQPYFIMFYYGKILLTWTRSEEGMNDIKGIAVQDMEATLYGLGSGLKSLLHVVHL